MIDGVNYNPFTNQVLTPEQIQKLDTDKNGKVSLEELEAGMSWLAGKDDDGEVKLGSDLYDNVKKAGLKTEKAKTQAEFKEAMEIVADEYQEMYFSEHKNMSPEQQTAIRNLIKNTKNAFTTKFINADPNGPWDIKLAAIEFENEIKQAAQDQEQKIQEQKAVIGGYVDNTDTNYESLINYTNSAFENNNVSESEWNQIKNKSIQYLMGLLLSDGREDEKAEFLSTISSNYQKNSYYSKAITAINKIKSSQDPAEIKQLMQEALTNVQKFFESCGKDRVSKGIKAYNDNKQQKELEKTLSSTADAWIEKTITANMTSAEKTAIKDFAKAAGKRFVEEFYSSGNNQGKSAVEAFKQYLDTEYTNYKANQNQVKSTYTNNIENLQNKMISTSDSAKSNGYVSDTRASEGQKSEKEEIIDAAVDYILAEYLNSVENIDILSNLSPNYGSSSELKDIKNIIAKIKSCSDPKEMETLLNEAKEAIANFLNKYSGEDIAKAIDATKPVEIKDTTANKAVFNSEIYSDYTTGAHKTGSRGKNTEEQRKEIEAMAREDLEKYAKSLKEQLKSELGSAYNEAMIDEIISKAINDTILVFWEESNKFHARGGDYSRDYGELGFDWGKRKNYSKVRYSYRVDSLIDTFNTKFNEAAKTVKKDQTNPATATYDKEDVLINAGFADEYGQDKTVGVIHKTSNAEKNLKKIGEIKVKARATIIAIAAEIKSSMVGNGSTIPSDVIDKLLDEAMMESISNIENRLKRMSVTAITAYSYTYKDLIDDFTGRVDRKFDEYMNKNK